MSRSAWHIRTSAVVLAWLTAAAIAAAMHRQLPAATWLMVHLLLLGGVTTALLVWSWHFSVAVLRAPQSPTRRGEALRITTANIGALGVIAGVLANTPIVTILGAVAVAGAVAAHVGALVIRLRRALPSRFAFTVRAYIAAGLLLIPGIVLGVLMARGTWDATTYSQLLLGHVTINLLGWVGLPILGTLVTLWPTMLHTRLAPDAERQARRALPLLIGGTLVTTAGALTGLDLLAAAGVAGYLLGIGLTVAPMVTEMRQRPPAVFASWSALAGVVWLSGTLIAFGIALASGSADALSRPRRTAGRRRPDRRRAAGPARLAQLPGPRDGRRRPGSDEATQRPRRPGDGPAPGDAEHGPGRLRPALPQRRARARLHPRARRRRVDVLLIADSLRP